MAKITPKDPTEIGANVRRRRLARNMTLDQLAEASSVSPTMLSEVERSVKNPTVKLAYQIARALGCSLTDLLEEELNRPPDILRADERRTLIDPETGVERHGLSNRMLKRGIETVSYLIPPGKSAGEMAANRPGILEQITVTAGTLTLELGNESHVLRKGDSMTYGPQATVEYRNKGRGSCEFFLISDSTQAH